VIKIPFSSLHLSINNTIFSTWQKMQKFWQKNTWFTRHKSSISMINYTYVIYFPTIYISNQSTEHTVESICKTTIQKNCIMNFCIANFQDHISIKRYTVDSLLFVGYKFSWISWEQANHEFKYQTYCNFSVDLLLKKWRNHKIKYPRNLILFYIHENWYPRK
jgi:hypothetical protein